MAKNYRSDSDELGHEAGVVYDRDSHSGKKHVDKDRQTADERPEDARPHYDEETLEKLIDATLSDVSQKLRKLITDTPKVESISDLSGSQRKLYKQVLVNKIRAQRQLFTAQSMQTRRGFSGRGIKRRFLAAGSRVLTSRKNSNRLLGFVNKYPMAGMFVGKFIAKQILKRSRKSSFSLFGRRSRSSIKNSSINLKPLGIVAAAIAVYRMFKSS